MRSSDDLVGQRYNISVPKAITGHDNTISGPTYTDTPDVFTQFTGAKPSIIEQFGKGEVRAIPFDHLLDPFDEQVFRTPERVAVICGTRSLTFAGLHEEANRLANHLRDVGVTSGAVVGVHLPRGLEFAVAVWSIVRAGAIYMPLDVRSPAELITTILTKTNAAAVITTNFTRSSILRPIKTVVLDNDETKLAIRGSLQNSRRIARSGDDLVYVINTSGSTGQPKSVVVRHRSFANLLDWYINALSLSQEDRCLIIGAMTFDACQKNIFAPLLVGGCLVFPDNDFFDPESLAEIIETQAITFINGTPSNVYPLVEGPGQLRPGRLSSLRWVVLGGEVVNFGRLRSWLRTSNNRARVLNTYGPTECTDICTSYAFGPEFEGGTVPLGRPLPNVRLAVLSHDGAPVSVGEPGELWIAGAGVGEGYLGQPDLTARVFRQTDVFGGPERAYRTGDRVRWREDGLLEFLGRDDDQIKFRGFRIELGEIEHAFGRIEGVRDAAVVLVEDEVGRQDLIAYLMTDRDTAISDALIRDRLRSMLPDHSVPSHFVRLERFPLTPNGKVDRKALLRHGPPRSAPAIRPQVAGDLDMTAQWANVLGHECFGVDDNFFDVGGNSLRLAELQANLSRAMNRPLPITLLFANPTVTRMTVAMSHGDPRPTEYRRAAVAPTGSRAQRLKSVRRAR